MNNTVIKDGKDFVKNHGRLLLLSVVVAVLCYGFLVFSGNIRIDTEELINEPGTTLGWLKIGRYSLVLLKRLLGLGTHHILWSALLFLLFFSAGGFFLAFLFYHASGKSEDYPYWVFILLYGSSNVWCYQVYFSLQQAEMALAMLLLAAAALLAMRASFEVRGRGNILRYAVAALLAVIGFGAYQALVAYYISICLGYFLIFLWRAQMPWQETYDGGRREESRRLYGGIARILTHFVLSYGFYMAIAYRWFMSTGAYLTGQKGWGRLSMIQCVKNILRTIERVVLCRGAEYFSFYTLGVLFSLLAVIWLLRRQWSGQKAKCVLFVLAWIAMLLTPFLMTVYMGEFIVIRAQFALPVAAAFLGMYGIGVLRRVRPGTKGIWKTKSAGVFARLFPGIAGFLVLLTMVVQTAYCMQLSYTDDVRNEQDLAFAKEVAERLRLQCGDDYAKKTIIFVGRKIPALRRGCARTEMYGWSFFEWDYSPDNPTGATHRILGYLRAAKIGNPDTDSFPEDADEEQREEARRLAGQMSDFPSNGCIMETKDFIVVRLSAEEGAR